MQPFMYAPYTWFVTGNGTAKTIDDKATLHIDGKKESWKIKQGAQVAGSVALNHGTKSRRKKEVGCRYSHPPPAAALPLHRASFS